jgi:two-component system alkaline phosphatase synthesis response regulator PhoP/two-component system response regulator VicR
VNLERQGYQVVTAFDGESCLLKVEAERPDVCLLDAAMPGMDGFEVLKRIRQNPETKRLPVIMLGAPGKNPEVFEGDSDGADLYLTEPFNPKDL